MIKHTNGRILHFAAGMLLAGGSAVAMQAQPRLAWSYEMPGEPYANYAVSIGDGGSQVFMDTGRYTRFTRLFSSLRSTSGSPEWELTEPRNAYYQQVASADKVDRHFSLWQEDGSQVATDRVVKLASYTSGNSQPDWTYQFPTPMPGHDMMSLACSEDGETCVVVLQDVYTSTERVWVFDGANQSAPLQFNANLTGWFEDTRLSGDGSTLYLTTGTRFKVFDTATGNELHSELLWGGSAYTGHGISNDGSVIAFSFGFGARIYARNAAGAYVAETPFTGLTNEAVNSIAVSSDGKLIAYGLLDATTNRSRVVVERRGYSGTLLDERYQGSGTVLSVCRELQFSGSGDRLAAVFTGDGTTWSNTPEVVVFERATSGEVSSSYSEFAAWETVGSRMELDLSADGRYLAVCGRDTHSTQGNGTKVVELYQLGGDLVLSGTPKRGANLQVSYWPKSFPNAWLIVTADRFQTPIETSAGGLWLNRANGLTVVPLTSQASTGMATGNFSLTGYAAGAQLHFQAYSSGPSRILSDSYHSLTVLP